MTRMWVNQPSVHQLWHNLHGTNVLADLSSNSPSVTIYFLSGDVIAQKIAYSALSKGWRRPK